VWRSGANFVVLYIAYVLYIWSVVSGKLCTSRKSAEFRSDNGVGGALCLHVLIDGMATKRFEVSVILTS